MADTDTYKTLGSEGFGPLDEHGRTRYIRTYGKWLYEGRWLDWSEQKLNPEWVDPNPEETEKRRAAIDAQLEVAKGGYTSEQIDECWKLLRAGAWGEWKKHWKMPVDAVVEDREFYGRPLAQAIAVTVPWYCGGPAPDVMSVKGGKLLVTHGGYYHYIGA